MMANYYEKLTKIFLTSGNSLYHAAAWGRYYAIVTSIGGRSDDEMSRLAGQVLVSALAVPVGLHGDEDDGRSKSTRLAALLGLSRPPTRAGLLKDAVSVLVSSHARVLIMFNSSRETFSGSLRPRSRPSTTCSKPPSTPSPSALPQPPSSPPSALATLPMQATAPSSRAHSSLVSSPSSPRSTAQSK